MDTHVDFNSTWAAPFQMFQTVEEDEELVHKEPVDKESEDEDPEGKKSEKRKKEKVLVYSTMSQGRGQPELRLFINYRVFGPQESPTKLALAITDASDYSTDLRRGQFRDIPVSQYLRDLGTAISHQDVKKFNYTFLVGNKRAAFKISKCNVPGVHPVFAKMHLKMTEPEHAQSKMFDLLLLMSSQRQELRGYYDDLLEARQARDLALDNVQTVLLQKTTMQTDMLEKFWYLVDAKKDEIIAKTAEIKDLRKEIDQLKKQLQAATAAAAAAGVSSPSSGKFKSFSGASLADDGISASPLSKPSLKMPKSKPSSAPASSSAISFAKKAILEADTLPLASLSAATQPSSSSQVATLPFSASLPSASSQYALEQSDDEEQDSRSKPQGSSSHGSSRAKRERSSTPDVVDSRPSKVAAVAAPAPSVASSSAAAPKRPASKLLSK